ncbi:MAG: hypothetical protein ACXVJZ_07715 [Acidimicrobiia bacterium]
MDDIVAVELQLPSGERRYVLTWGRVHHNVDPRPLEALVLRKASKFGLGDAVSATVCWSLQDASSETYFYECLAELTAQWAEPRDDWTTWKAEGAARMEDGYELFYLGEPRPSDEEIARRRRDANYESPR